MHHFGQMGGRKVLASGPVGEVGEWETALTPPLAGEAPLPIKERGFVVGVGGDDG
jgi:hypothetical protein